MLPLHMTVFFGLLTSLGMPALILYCIYQTPRYRFTENTLSYLGSSKKTAHIWRPTMVIGSILTTLFMISVINFIDLMDNNIIIGFVIASGVCMLLIPLTVSNFRRRKKVRLVHNISSAVFFLLTSINIIIIQLNMFSYNVFIAFIGLLLGLAIFIGTPMYFLKFKISSLPELFFIFLVCCWTLFVSLGLYFL